MAVNLKDLPAALQKQVMRKMNEAEGRKGGKPPTPQETGNGFFDSASLRSK